MFLANDIEKPWCICLKGDPIEVISARDKNAIIIKCGGQHLTVSQYDITDVAPTKTITPEPKAPVHQVTKPAQFGKIPKRETIAETPKHPAKPSSQTSIF